ncbi:hypothetical protein CONCODRAFT_161043 [Conidiobolus coronatus NRRL 28638]|uniref:Uncharacterized protein n=1 Tax=Conidiobolus coronatus (strain ATCC 28846 / CBS 209.66 / NRRL 28638) TaxID=796925 RepID=A0A137P5Y1_CONC2|nr:hypothetical protein CONCODRAFT_161043 [Conidiobolus coronatus NRRL 28638]|eukprot:KXN70415.1 hypothetical protein CONCODRAFT_161043 [Conidiobolus coronatus NRRL 28638]
MVDACIFHGLAYLAYYLATYSILMISYYSFNINLLNNRRYNLIIIFTKFLEKFKLSLTDLNNRK